VARISRRPGDWARKAGSKPPERKVGSIVLEREMKDDRTPVDAKEDQPQPLAAAQWATSI
jgi:hypothetical protein